MKTNLLMVELDTLLQGGKMIIVEFHLADRETRIRETEPPLLLRELALRGQTLMFGRYSAPNSWVLISVFDSLDEANDWVKTLSGLTSKGILPTGPRGFDWPQGAA